MNFNKDRAGGCSLGTSNQRPVGGIEYRGSRDKNLSTYRPGDNNSSVNDD